MGKRIFRLALGILLLAFSFPARAPQPEKILRIGYRGNSSPALERDFVDAFRQGLRDPAYAEGHTILIEYRWAAGRSGRLPEFAAALRRARLDARLMAAAGGA